MESEITKISSKGQVVIPFSLRRKMGIREGESFIVSEKDNLIVLKKVEGSITEDDLDTIERIKEAWKDVEEGRFKKMEKEELLTVANFLDITKEHVEDFLTT